jgi:hypothetical protein
MQIGLFICLNHELVNDYDIGIGYPLKRLQAEARFSFPLFSHLYTPTRLWHPVEALRITRAGYIDETLLVQLAVLLAGKDRVEKLTGSLPHA